MSTSCKVLAVGTLHEPVSSARVVDTLPFEAPATLQLYLDGCMDQFWAFKDNTAVVFLMNASSVDEAHALLDKLPLTKAGLMSFECTALVPLAPLGILIAGAPTH
jgi:muconolactone delta-isomerase